MLHNIEPEALELEQQGTKLWPKRLLWGGLSTVATLLLVAQLVWLQFDYFSRAQPYRNWPQPVPKPWLQLPAMRDTANIKTYIWSCEVTLELMAL